MPDQDAEQYQRDQFLDHVRVMVEYWDGQLLPSAGPPESYSTRQRLDGLAHSMLTAIDQKGFVLVPEDSPYVTEKVMESAISGVLNDDLFNQGMWSPNRP